MGLIGSVIGSVTPAGILAGGSSTGNFVNDITGVSGQNQANSAMAAQQQQWTQQNMATAYGYDQAAYTKSLADQTQLANTAHQREVADLKAAGLNPILSGTGGSGAATPNVKMDTPGALPGATGNQGMKGGSALDVLGSALQLVNSAKDRELTDAKITDTQRHVENQEASTQNINQEMQRKYNTLQDNIDADRAEAMARKTSAQNETMYNLMDKKNPNSSYFLHRLSGPASNSAKSLMSIVGALTQ